MGTLAETAIVDYRLSFADHGKQTSVFRFRLQANKRKFAISIFRLNQFVCHLLIVQTEVCRLSVC
jgi:hypothetical protein